MVKIMRFWTGDTIKELKENQIFVFGSNPQGRHGAGAAKAAMSFGAKYGVGRGLQGQTYALITKNLEVNYKEKATGIVYEKEGYNSVSPEQISKNVDDLYECAKQNSDKLFVVVYKNETWPNGSSKKSLNGYTGEEIFNIFAEQKEVPKNIIFHDSFKPLALLLDNKKEVVAPQAEQEYEFFWKSKSVFSQWHPAKFAYKDVTFASAEQFMMYSKAKLFGDDVTAQKVLDVSNDPLIQDFLNGKITNEQITNDRNTLAHWDKLQKTIKDLGKEVKPFNEPLWLSKRVPIVSVGTREKFAQNDHLKQPLMACKNKKMVEASPYDKIWGIGLKKEDAIKMSPEKWPGENLLGDIVTNTRIFFENELKNKQKQKP